MAAETRPDGETTGRGHSLCQQSADVCYADRRLLADCVAFAVMFRGSRILGAGPSTVARRQAALLLADAVSP